MNRLKRIRLSAILADIIRCFMMSCGMVLLLVFFGYEFITFTKLIITKLVFVIFFLFLIVSVYQEILLKGERWFYNSNTIFVLPASGSTVELVADENKEVSEHNKKITAIHEAGHAVMAYLKKLESFDVQISYISPKVVTVYKEANAQEVKSMILIKYAGALAEELLLGSFHSGCMGNSEADFESATELIKAYIVMTNSSVSKTLLNEELSSQIIMISKELYQEARDILCNNKEMIQTLAEELLKKGSLTKKAISDLLSKLKKVKIN